MTVIEQLQHDDLMLIVKALRQLDTNDGTWLANMISDVASEQGFVTYGIVVGESKLVTDWK